MHCAILKALYDFNEKRAHKERDMQSFLQNVQNEIFKILKMFKYNMKFPRVACSINSKITTDKHTTLMIFLFSHYCWSLLWWNYWRSLMLWNSTCWSRLKWTVEIHLAFCLCNPFVIHNHNMTGNSVEKQCFVVLNVKLEVKLKFKTFYWLQNC